MSSRPYEENRCGGAKHSTNSMKTSPRLQQAKGLLGSTITSHIEQLNICRADHDERIRNYCKNQQGCPQPQRSIPGAPDKAPESGNEGKGCCLHDRRALVARCPLGGSDLGTAGQALGAPEFRRHMEMRIANPLSPIRWMRSAFALRATGDNLRVACQSTFALRATADRPGEGWRAVWDEFRNWVSLGFQPAKRNENL
jgi:hypothetical protein